MTPVQIIQHFLDRLGPDQIIAVDCQIDNFSSPGTSLRTTYTIYIAHSPAFATAQSHFSATTLSEAFALADSYVTAKYPNAKHIEHQTYCPFCSAAEQDQNF